MSERQESGKTLHQRKCGCWKSTRPSRRPWYYKPGSWSSWKPISRGGDEWCRWTLVLGVGPITGVVVIPVRQCHGCEDCGPQALDYRYYPEALTPTTAPLALERERQSQIEWDLSHPEDSTTSTEGETQS